MRSWPIVAVVLMLAASAQAAPPGGATGADAKFKALYTREWAWRMNEFPERERGDAPVPDRLPKVDPASEARRLAYWQAVRKDLDAIPETALSEGERVNYAVYRDQIDVLISQQKFHEYEKPFNSDSSFWSGLGFTASRKFHNAQDYRNYIALLNDVPRYFREEEDEMRAGLKRGFTPPKATLVGRDASVTNVSEAKGAEATNLWKPFKAYPAAITPAERTQFEAQAKQAIETKVMPAFARLLTFLRQDYIPHTTEALAAEAQPDGKAYYKAQIKEFTTLDMEPEAIHQLGLSEVAKIHAQMLEVMKETGFKGDFPAFLTYLRTDPKFYTKDPQDLLNRAAWIAKRVDGKASQFFGWLPRSRFGIEPVSPDIAPFYTSARGGTSTYLLNTYDLPSRPLYNLTALTLHESAPGHSFQGGLAEEQTGLPDFRREVYISAYGEGWALYCEKLGVEMGMYDTPYDRFGMLTFQMWRAARLVVDTGVHHKGWTRAQAIAFLHDNTALADHDIEIEVDRYISWPGQALSYYLGMMAISEARAKAEAALGPKFDIRAFHDTVLSMGSVPLPLLRARIDRFIAEGGRDPMPVTWQKPAKAAPLMANLYDVLAEGFPADRRKPAFLLSDGASVSYGQLEAGAAYVAGHLIAEGVQPGDRVGLQVEKSVEAVMIYLGVLKAGAVFLPLNSAYTPAEVAYFIGDAEPASFIIDAGAFMAEARTAAPLAQAVERNDSQLASLIYTSGTTGRSKGAMLSHGALAANALALHEAWGFTPDDVLLHALPIFHVHGLFVALHCAFLSGAPMVWLPKFDDAQVLEGLARSTVMMGVPTFYTRLLANPGFTKETAANIRVFISGSAPLLESTFAEFEERTGQRILERYGMSEAVIITSNPLTGDRVPGSVGYPLPGVELRIGGGEATGVIQIRGPSVFSGYWRMPEKTAEEFTADDFFITGDVGRCDPDGRVWISGRAKDLIISGGYNVYPKEVELVLDELPGVTESAVVGVPHPDFGEGVVAVVIGQGEEAAMIAETRRQLAAYKAPKRIVFVTELPRNAMGKVQKNLLRDRYADLFKAGS